MIEAGIRDDQFVDCIKGGSGFREEIAPDGNVIVRNIYCGPKLRCGSKPTKSKKAGSCEVKGQSLEKGLFT